MISDEQLSRRARRLAGAIEPVVGQVYFSPECHAAYQALGFGGSPGEVGGVALPDGPAYFTSRGSALGQASGPLVAATFAVFNPDIVIAAVDRGWSLTDASTIATARTQGATAQLQRVLGERPDGIERASELLAGAAAPLRPEGRPLYAGVLAQGLPGDPLGDLFRTGDLLREHRGDSHTAAWVAAGFDATEIGLLTELFWGIPPRTYVRTRAWTDAQLDAATERLTSRGLLIDGAFTDGGRAAREAVEWVTDMQQRPALEALGDDFDELIEVLEPWGRSIRLAGGYPASPAQIGGN